MLILFHFALFVKKFLLIKTQYLFYILLNLFHTKKLLVEL